MIMCMTHIEDLKSDEYVFLILLKYIIVINDVMYTHIHIEIFEGGTKSSF